MQRKKYSFSSFAFLASCQYKKLLPWFDCIGFGGFPSYPYRGVASPSLTSTAPLEVTPSKVKTLRARLHVWEPASQTRHGQKTYIAIVPVVLKGSFISAVMYS
ncbi:MAG: hypothetical protein LDL41_12760 [Coleofasciculus sp. S288]|nr:hypothetical protein [Coleofasciculus sp. S288]